MARDNTIDGSAPKPAWLHKLKGYESPNTGKALWQIANTLLPYAGLWALMIYALGRGLPYWMILPLIVLASLFLVRMFIFFHDCCHGSFLPNRAANRIVGTALGVLTFTAYDEFRHSHGVHHSTAGNLDRRGVGDVWTMTVDEFRGSHPWRRLNYRMYRHPLVLFLLGPVLIFLVTNRLPRRGANARRVMNVLMTNLLILAVAAAMGLTWGWTTYLRIQLPILSLAGIMGIWLFYVQHQFDPTYWTRNESWSYTDAALQGSSYYRLPRVLQWLSGNIGLHHVHHLRPRIPNYRLQACLDAIPQLRLEDPLTIRKSLSAIWLNLWDERMGRLVRFADARSLRTSVPT
jgi:omega-6 fatty acid desaturase (delta-12 desaturase)